MCGSGDAEIGDRLHIQNIPKGAPQSGGCGLRSGQGRRPAVRIPAIGLPPLFIIRSRPQPL